MKVYKVECDVNRFQSFVAEDGNVWATGALTFDGSPKADTWRQVKMRILEPNLIAGDFIRVASGAFAVRDRAVEVIRTVAERSGELLPLDYRGERFWVINSVGAFDLLDHDAVEWVYGKSTGKPIGVKKYAFSPSIMVERPLFKLPHSARGFIFTTEGLMAPEDEFKGVVEAAGLTGLLFKEVWSDRR